jgi:N-acetylglucosaminyldiphosphoundecaprenol N-acetyl-beta-D-mannosaminyltransferase
MYLPYGDVTWEVEELAAGRATVEAAQALPARVTPPPPPTPTLPSVSIMGVTIHALNEPQTISHILGELDAGRGGFVVTPNLDHIRRCQNDVSFAALVAEANLVVPDGMPVVWASKIAGTPVPQRVAGSDLIISLSKAAAGAGRSIFLLGGVPGTADSAARILKQRFPELIIAGTYCPPMGFEDDHKEMARMLEALRAAQPDIIFVALGSPKQEFLVDRIGRTMPRSWWLGVGISFSFLSGKVKRAPRWLQKLGLEWTHRLMQEPRRLFKRYILVGVPFAARMFSSALQDRINRKLGLEREPAYVAARAAGIAAELAERPYAQRREAVEQLTTDANLGSPAIIARSEAVTTASNLPRIRELVLLGGTVRATEFSNAIGRSVLDLPLDETQSIFTGWLQHAADLASHAGLESLPVRVTLNRDARMPTSAAERFRNAYKIERDLSEFRGTGGILRDLVEQYEDDDYILVANAAQLLLDPLPAIAAALDRRRSDVSLIAHRDGTPSGLMLLRCKTLRLISTVGFVDMKEQALPLIAALHDVRAVQTRRPTGLAIRSMADYLGALRHHKRRGQRRAESDFLNETWDRTFAIVEAGASVDESAYIHDSVVLQGARVEAGAAVVRSVVCPGSAVRRDQQLADTLHCVADR